MKTNSIHKEIWINAPIERAFASFTDAEAMLAWHGKEIEVNPVPGGIYKVTFEDGTTILGEYKEVSPHSRVIYSANYNGVDSLITIDFLPRDGGTLIKLQQEFDPEQVTSSFDHGWNYFLQILQDHFGEVAG
ncbi:MAG: SRPBCC domain-containing protein [Cyanothece sp. SIO1E1]|nr:SRPBCC domain-containing protein [Cyanothece sp. SIO1E1]